MLRTAIVRVGSVAMAWAWLTSGSALAQVGSNASSTPLASATANPYLNPYFNPYLNPMISSQPMTGQNALLYMYMANSANGGIGSGRLSGTRGAAAPVGARKKPAELPYTAHPGGGASRYFNPGPGSGNMAGRYYNQRGRYFQNNGQ